MTRQQMKYTARTAIAGSKPSPLFGGAIITIILFAIMVVLNMGIVKEYQTLVDKYIESGTEIDYEKIAIDIYNIAANAKTGVTDMIVTLVMNLISLYITFGFFIYTLKIARKNSNVHISEMFPPLKLYLKYAIMSIIRGILTMVFFMLFIVPGIILYFSYSQAPYLMIDHPEWSPIKCLNESRRLMRGKKMQFFTLWFSFLGWTIISSMLVIFGVWSNPYIYVTNAVFYDELICGVKKPSVEIL
ncbi:MAG: DUF975 family protein [Clostridia bacterium]